MKPDFAQKVIILSMLLASSCGVLPVKVAEREYRKKQSEATDEAISKSAVLTELNSICTTIDLPPNFEFVSKFGVDEQKRLLTYYFKSTTPFNDSKAIFQKGLTDKGWTYRDLSDRYPPQLEFGKDEYKVVVTYQENYSLSNYGIDCEKIH